VATSPSPGKKRREAEASKARTEQLQRFREESSQLERAQQQEMARKRKAADEIHFAECEAKRMEKKKGRIEAEKNEAALRIQHEVFVSEKRIGPGCQRLRLGWCLISSAQFSRERDHRRHWQGEREAPTTWRTSWTLKSISTVSA